MVIGPPRRKSPWPSSPTKLWLSICHRYRLWLLTPHLPTATFPYPCPDVVVHAPAKLLVQYDVQLFLGWLQTSPSWPDPCLGYNPLGPKGPYDSDRRQKPVSHLLSYAKVVASAIFFSRMALVTKETNMKRTQVYLCNFCDNYHDQHSVKSHLVSTHLSMEEVPFHCTLCRACYV